ncbi:MAG: T9SS type A sorting domain-containing protein [Candidatus Zixiibacteriota bacterium]|nr:MAG: T9SS type A sorting domain-containing protein [candidate division Zixibacteria bacterium]
MNYWRSYGTRLLPAGVVMLATVLLEAAVLRAAPPMQHMYHNMSLSDEQYDLTTYIDVNNLLCFITNSGSLGMDHARLFDRPDGFYYPYTGDTADIRNGIEDRTLVYAAGLTLAGKVSGELRTAVAAYDMPEFVPGPLTATQAPPDPAEFRVYKLNQDSGPGDPDYDSWPVQYGAPADEQGAPMKLGDQTLWAVFNDADSTVHHNYYGGGTKPLGIEVQLTAWGWQEPDEEENVFYLRYKLYNRGNNQIDSFYITFWADPDLGGPNDDLVGCDTLHDLFFAYNGDDDDAYYDDIIPAWGGRVISGPVVPSPGDTADFAGSPLPDHRNIGITAFARYINGTEPDSPEQLFQYMQGRDAGSDQPYVDPVSGDTIAFYAPGDAVARIGWVDQVIWDQRILTSFGPMSFNPGDSQQVSLKIGAYAEGNRMFSLSVLRNILDPNIPIDSTPDTINYVAADSAVVSVTDFGLDNVFFFPIKERWLTGVNWGGAYFYGGVDYAKNFTGSALDPVTHADSFHAVEIRFSHLHQQNAYRYVREESGEYNYGGYYPIPFTVWDVSNGRQLNAAFVEWVGTQVFDSTWWPDFEVNLGGREFLLIFNSDYSGTDPAGSAIDYTDIELFDAADSIDLLYFCWLALTPGADAASLKEGQKLIFEGQFLNPNGPVDSLLFRPTKVGQTSQQAVIVKTFADGPSSLAIFSSAPEAFSPSSDLLQFIELREQRIGITFSPSYNGYFSELLYITDRVSGIILDTVRLVAKTPEITDVPDAPRTLPIDFMLTQNYPNPFNPSTTIEYTIPVRTHVSLAIFNILGRRVETLVNDFRGVGRYSVEWDGTDVSGRRVSSGIYFYQIRTDSRTETKKMLLLK